MQRFKLAENIGFCSGVRRAIHLAEQTLAKSKNKVYSLGPVIHNPEVIKRLKSAGLSIVTSLEAIPNSSILILPSHGSPRNIFKIAREKSLKLVDVTCPHVSLIQKTCDMLSRQDLEIIIIGNCRHPEIRALLDIAKRACTIEKEKDIKANSFSHKKIGIISQTTQSTDTFFDLVNTILRKNPLVKEVHVFNTICRDTINRQHEAKRLAGSLDCLLVVGSRTSANTKRLFEIGRKINQRTYLVENEQAVSGRVIKGARTIGLISGASTPKWLVKMIIDKIKIKFKEE